ncbi:hypothetical protein NL676_001529 [Syzygium grande]|nr:hypothetical protein NL676_001529 [Syzygium grande]
MLPFNGRGWSGQPPSSVEHPIVLHPREACGGQGLPRARNTVWRRVGVELKVLVSGEWRWWLLEGGGAMSSRSICRLALVSSHLSPNPLMASEKEAAPAAAAAAAAAAPSDSPTIFDKIIKKEIPSTVVFEDDKVLAFRDISPQAPTHILIIPKVKDGLTGLSKAEERHREILGHLLYTAKLVAKQEGLEDGYRVVINDGPSGCQSVYHIHVHLLGGRQMNWPPG